MFQAPRNRKNLAVHQAVFVRRLNSKCYQPDIDSKTSLGVFERTMKIERVGYTVKCDTVSHFEGYQLPKSGKDCCQNQFGKLNPQSKYHSVPPFRLKK